MGRGRNGAAVVIRVAGVLVHAALIALLAPLIFILVVAWAQPGIRLLAVAFVAIALAIVASVMLWRVRRRAGRLVLASLDIAVLVVGIVIRTSDPGPWYDLGLGLVGLGLACVVADALLATRASGAMTAH